MHRNRTAGEMFRIYLGKFGSQPDRRKFCCLCGGKVDYIEEKTRDLTEAEICQTEKKNAILNNRILNFPFIFINRFHSFSMHAQILRSKIGLDHDDVDDDEETLASSRIACTSASI